MWKIWRTRKVERALDLPLLLACVGRRQFSRNVHTPLMSSFHVKGKMQTVGYASELSWNQLSCVFWGFDKIGHSRGEMTSVALLSVILILNQWCYLLPHYGCLRVCLAVSHPVHWFCGLLLTTLHVNSGWCCCCGYIRYMVRGSCHSPKVTAQWTYHPSLNVVEHITGSERKEDGPMGWGKVRETKSRFAAATHVIIGRVLLFKKHCVVSSEPPYPIPGRQWNFQMRAEVLVPKGHGASAPFQLER